MHSLLDFEGQRLEMPCQFVEQLSLFSIGCQVADHLALGDLHPELF
jgi:hypothetical protein